LTDENSEDDIEEFDDDDDIDGVDGVLNTDDSGGVTKALIHMSTCSSGVIPRENE
jgi:hypothetical protein